MAGYIGLKCFKCKETFIESDDIVVCPDCGTPYHRSCYLTEGKCINNELHEKHESYNANKERAKNTGTIVYCPRCNEENPPLSLFCDKCGMPLSNNTPDDEKNMSDNQDFEYENYGKFIGFDSMKINFSDPLCGFNPEEDFDGVKTRELGDFIGQNTYYYLPVFKRIKETKIKFSWNFSGMLFPIFYYAYRKMWLYSIISIFIQTILSIPTFIVAFQSQVFGNSMIAEFARGFDVNSGAFSAFYNVTNILSYIFMFCTGAFTNWLYYRHCLSKIDNLKQKGTVTKQILNDKGGVSKLNVVIISVIIFFISTIFTAITLLL